MTSYCHREHGGRCGVELVRPSWRCVFKSYHKRACSRFSKHIACSRSEQPLLFGGKSTRRSTLDSTHGLRAGEFFAVKDVSFELRRGECLGLIGHKGAGKTTLLKMLNGLIKPDAGSITMRGRALIALGAGFNPILTGREPKGWEARRMSNRRLAQRVQRRSEGANQNIYINGSVLGLTKKEPERRRCAEEPKAWEG